MSLEEDVGIKAYTTTTDPFTGILRHRSASYVKSDFLCRTRLIKSI